MAAWGAANGAQSASGEQLGLLAHDLRAPISSICGAAQIALESLKRGARVEEYLTQILGAARALDAMTGELLGGGEETPVHADALALELRALALERMRQRDQRFTLDLSALEGRRLFGDGAALCRVLANLLSNASKYTPRGGHISLTAAASEGDAGEILATFAVRDDGVGMSKAFMERMYQPRERAPETADAEGQGLGLCSVRQLVERMRGTIEVQSRPGEGTCFTVRVPLRRSGAADGALEGMSLLVSGNTLTDGRVLAALLTARGACVDVARDGVEAAQKAAKSPEAYGAAVLDLDAPEHVGLDAVRAIRARCGHMKLVALGGGAKQALAAGADAWLPKPVDMRALCAALTGE